MGNPSEPRAQGHGALDSALAAHVASLIHIVDHGSLSAAARAVGLPKSTLSRHVAQLEDALGAPVLVRGHQTLGLTELGAQLVSDARGPLAALSEALGNAAGRAAAPRGLVRMTAPVEYGALVASMILELLRVHPEIDVDLALDNAPVDLRREKLDLAIRVGPIHDEALIARAVGRIQGVLVASPAFVDRHPVLLTAASPACLSGIPCAIYTSPTFSSAWTLHAEGKPPVDVSVGGRFMSNSLTTVRAAAVAGFGVARLPLYVVREEIAAGRLLVVLPGWATPARTVSLVYPPSRHQAKRVRAVIQFFLGRAKERKFDG